LIKNFDHPLQTIRESGSDRLSGVVFCIARSPFFKVKLKVGVAVCVCASLCVPRSSGRWYWGVSVVAKNGFEKNEDLSLKPSPLLPHNQLAP